MLEIVQFYLHQREPVVDPLDSTRSVDGGFLLVFKFVRRHWDDIVQIALNSTVTQYLIFVIAYMCKVSCTVTD